MALISWALKRQILYIGILVAFLAVASFLIIYPKLNNPPTCTDNRQNGNETGVDCGGSCRRACFAETDPISVLWSRAFKVVPGRYNAVAFLENHNQNTAVNKINYRFRFADGNNVYIGERLGSTFIPPSGRFAVFEPAIDVGNSVPVYVNFEFTEVPQWISVPQATISQLRISVSDIKLEDEATSPRLSASIKNNSFFTIPEVNFIAVLYNESGNAVSTSRTFLDVLNPEQSTEIHFTWPEPLTEKVVVKEIIPMFNVFLIKLK